MNAPDARQYWQVPISVWRGGGIPSSDLWRAESLMKLSESVTLPVCQSDHNKLVNVFHKILLNETID